MSVYSEIVNCFLEEGETHISKKNIILFKEHIPLISIGNIN